MLMPFRFFSLPDVVAGLRWFLRRAGPGLGSSAGLICTADLGTSPPRPLGPPVLLWMKFQTLAR